jgi:hypothetical protein
MEKLLETAMSTWNQLGSIIAAALKIAGARCSLISGEPSS